MQDVEAVVSILRMREMVAAYGHRQALTKVASYRSTCVETAARLEKRLSDWERALADGDLDTGISHLAAHAVTEAASDDEAARANLAKAEACLHNAGAELRRGQATVRAGEVWRDARRKAVLRDRLNRQDEAKLDLKRSHGSIRSNTADAP